MIKISKYLNPKLVLFLQEQNRDEALQAMVYALHREGKLEDAESFYKAIIDRERIVSTGIGMGVAIPHAKLTSCDDFFLAIGIAQHGIEWNALDGAPVRAIFMIGGPDDKQTEYLQILSRLTFALKDEHRRKKMLTLNSPNAIIDLLKAF
jgi:PTS system nitrogen regulatory IIA component